MVFDMGCGDDVFGQFGDGVGAAGGFEFAVESEAFHDGEQVDGLALGEEFEDGAVDSLMLRLVEVFGMEGFDDVDECRLVEHEGAEHALLDGDGLRGCVAVDVERLRVCYSFLASWSGCGHSCRVGFECTKVRTISDTGEYFFSTGRQASGRRHRGAACSGRRR